MQASPIAPVLFFAVVYTYGPLFFLVCEPCLVREPHNPAYPRTVTEASGADLVTHSHQCTLCDRVAV